MQLQPATEAPTGNALTGRVLRKQFSGVNSTYHIQTKAGEISVVVPNSSDRRFGIDEMVTATWSADSAFPVA